MHWQNKRSRGVGRDKTCPSIFPSESVLGYELGYFPIESETDSDVLGYELGYSWDNDYLVSTLCSPSGDASPSTMEAHAATPWQADRVPQADDNSKITLPFTGVRAPIKAAACVTSSGTSGGPSQPQLPRMQPKPSPLMQLGSSVNKPAIHQGKQQRPDQTQEKSHPSTCEVTQTQEKFQSRCQRHCLQCYIIKAS